MLEGELTAGIEEFPGRHEIRALVTAGAGVVRNTTVEYVYVEGAFWIVSKGDLRSWTLQANSNVCLVIHDKDISFDTLAGLQATGTVEVFEPFGAGYEHACLPRSIPVERLRKLLFVMGTIEMVPTRYDCVSGRLEKRGFSAR